jgi:hypothetical protein
VTAIPSTVAPGGIVKPYPLRVSVPPGVLPVPTRQSVVAASRASAFVGLVQAGEPADVAEVGAPVWLATPPPYCTIAKPIALGRFSSIPRIWFVRYHTRAGSAFSIAQA